MAKAPPVQRRADKPLRVGYDGRSWLLRFSEVTPRDVADLRKSTGMSVQGVVAAASGGDLDLDIAAALIFLARRQSGEPRITFDAAIDGLSYDSEFTWGLDDDGEDDDSPEA